jgi:hypothetical protein
MLPLNRLSEALVAYQKAFHDQFEDLINATELVISKPNILQKEDNGMYSIQAVGTLDSVIKTLTNQLEKLTKVKAELETKSSD